MAKRQKGTPKNISARIKERGLKKLRFYCQICQKECRDQSGFNSHINSQKHNQMASILAPKAGSLKEKWSNEFKNAFLTTLRTQYGTKPVHFNSVYRQHIRDRSHTRMNATRYKTLTGFVYAMQKQGILNVEDTEHGLYVQFIDNSAEEIARKSQLQKKIKNEQLAVESNSCLLSSQISAQANIEEDETLPTPTKAPKKSISFSFSKPLKSSTTTKPSILSSEGKSSPFSPKNPQFTMLPGKYPPVLQLESSKLKNSSTPPNS